MNDFHTAECCAEHGCPKPCNFCKYPLKDAINAKRKEIEAASPTLASNWGMRASLDSIDADSLEKLRLQDEADSLRAQLATATERATKAEAEISRSERENADLQTDLVSLQVENNHFRDWYVELKAKNEALEKDRERLDWLQEQTTDTIYLDDGRIVDVKGDSVRAAIDAAIAQSGTEVKPNGLTSDTFASGTDWRGN